MTEHVHECEHKNISVLIFGFRCEDCGEMWDIANAINAIRATERLSAEDARTIAEVLGNNLFKRAILAYADILEGKDD